MAMVSREITKGIYWVGALDFDRRIFDELIPLPEGTSYNSYLVRGSTKTALIDTVDPSKEEDLILNLIRLGVERIDYVVINHAEQDHSGSLPMILEMYPGAKVVTNEKCKDLLVSLLQIPPQSVMVIKDGETLSLGDRTLQFFLTPWTHWPETQVTYLQEDRILFPCDLFGYHVASSDLFVTDETDAYRSAKRYYAEIMMPFRNSIRGYIEKIRALPLDMIAPSHGPVHRNPKFILDAYAGWVSDDVKNEVVIPYISMHGSTRNDGETPDSRAHRAGHPGQTIQPHPHRYRGTCPRSRGRGHGCRRDADRPLRPPPSGGLCHVPGQCAEAESPVCDGNRILWMGRQVGRDDCEDARSCQGRGLEPVVIKGAPDEAAMIALDRLADEILKKHKESNIV